MSRVLMLDLGDTLVRAGSVLPHVPAALDALAAFVGPDDGPLPVCLVSDFEMVPPPPTPRKVRPVFKKFLQLLDRLELRSHFEPADRRVTLSTHAGALAPDQKLFTLAIERLGVAATLAEAIFVTGNLRHAAHCRRVLGMRALRFGDDFEDWADGPLLVADLLGVSANLAPAIAAWGEAHGMEGLSIVERPPGPGRIRAQGQQWVSLRAPELGRLDGLHVRLPAAVELTLDASGRVASFRADPPSPDVVAESVHYVRGLLDRGAVEEEGAPAARLATHRVETDGQGRRYLRRAGFTGRR